MIVNSLSLKNFRNEEDCTVEFTDGVNIICGDNAAGKTNLLEAVFLFAAGKSFRGVKNGEMIKFGCEKATVNINFSDRYSKKSFGITLARNKKRALSREGVPITKLSEFLGVFRAVIFTPDHMSLIKGAPENRRRFADMAICQAYPRYVAALNEYNRLLEQRNALLKSNRLDGDLLSVYTQKMYQLAGDITLRRSRYIEKLQLTASQFHSSMTNGAETLKIKYLPGVDCDITEQSAITERYISLSALKRNTEIECGATLIGPHRDDLAFIVNDKNARSYCSQGQQRSAVISVKLAEAELSSELTNEYPVLLLDDVLSELDESRRSFILERLEGRQVLLTGCENENFFSVKQSGIIKVQKGKICTCT